MEKFERDLDRWIEREDPAIAEQDAYDRFVDYHLEKGNCKIVDKGESTEKIVWLKKVEIRSE
jgi:hypothetical protein